MAPWLGPKPGKPGRGSHIQQLPRLLEPGESQTLTLTWHVMDMASYNEKSASWELDKGEYQWMAAASSADVRDTVVQKIAKSSKVKTLDVMKPQAAIPVNPMVKR